MMYKRLDGETDEALIKRVCSEKEAIGTWDKVAEILNGLLGYEYGEAKYRKQYSRMLAEDEIPEDTKAFELTMERKKLQATKVEWNREVLHQARFELFYHNIANAIRELDPPKFNELSAGKRNKKEFVLGFGDIHYGANFKSQNNEYSREIAKKRFEKLLAETIQYIKFHNVKELKIINVGDNIQGILRLSDLQINDTSVTMCVVEVSQLISEFLNRLSKYVKIDYYHVTQSNHTQTRNLGSKASELAGEDVEKIIANYIHDVLRLNKRVNVNFDNEKEYLEFKVFDFECICEHGHRIKNPKTYIKDTGSLQRKIFNYGFLGHTHSSQEIIVAEDETSNSEVLILPSFVGSDPYADSLKVGSKAAAKVFEFDPYYGHVGSKNIFLN